MRSVPHTEIPSAAQLAKPREAWAGMCVLRHTDTADSFVGPSRESKPIVETGLLRRRHYWVDPASQVFGEQTLKLPTLILSQAEISAAAFEGGADPPEFHVSGRSMAGADSQSVELLGEKRSFVHAVVRGCQSGRLDALLTRYVSKGRLCTVVGYVKLWDETHANR